MLVPVTQHSVSIFLNISTPCWITALLWWRGLCSSMKLWAMLCRVTQDEWVIVKSSNKMPPWRRKWHPIPVFSPQVLHEQYEKAKRYDAGRWAARVRGIQHATGGGWREIMNSSRNKEATGPKQKWHSVVDEFGSESKCYKEQYCIGTWNIRSMNQCVKYFLPYWWARNVTATSNFQSPNADEGSQKGTLCLWSRRCHHPPWWLLKSLGEYRKQPSTTSATP